MATSKKTKKSVSNGIVTIQSTFNNTIISITDQNGEVLVQGSPPVVGFKGSRRSTAFAATKAAQDAAEKAIKK